MVIYAAAKFRCQHRYVTTVDGEQLMFVCDKCSHRTELLCLDQWKPDHSVVAFPLPDVDRLHPTMATDESAA